MKIKLLIHSFMTRIRYHQRKKHEHKHKTTANSDANRLSHICAVFDSLDDAATCVGANMSVRLLIIGVVTDLRIVVGALIDMLLNTLSDTSIDDGIDMCNSSTVILAGVTVIAVELTLPVSYSPKEDLTSVCVEAVVDLDV